MRTKHEYYRRFYIPATIKLWNELPLPLRSTTDTPFFKNELKDRTKIITPKYLHYGSRQANIYHCTLRLGCSNLTHDLYQIGVVESPLCQNCNSNTPEDTKHFLFECNTYIEQRAQMLHDIGELLHNHTEIAIDPKLLLYGNLQLDTQINEQLFHLVQRFIMTSKRFNLI